MSENNNLYEEQANGLIYHFKNIAGIKTAQLVLPKPFRMAVLESAHDSQWSMHFGVRKTIQRIELIFIGLRCPKTSNIMLNLAMYVRNAYEKLNLTECHLWQFLEQQAHLTKLI